MKNQYYLLLTLFLMSTVFTVNAQQNQSLPNSYSGSFKMLRVEPSLSSKKKLKKPIPLTEAPNDGRSSKNLVVPGKDKQMDGDALALNPNKLKGKLAGKTPSLVYEVNNTVSSPSDPAIAVGPNHVFTVYNTGLIIYDKEGNALTGPMNVNNIFSNGGCCDLTASYDNAADRWVLSYLFVGSGAEIAVSDGPDPVNADWYVYSIPQINDYQKLSVWGDGYYITENTSGSSNVWALDRTAMLAGDASPSIQGFSLPGISTSGFYSPQVLNVTDDNLPAAGGATVVYLQDDAWGGVSEDHIKFWTIDVDWANAANSTVSSAVQFPVTDFVGVFDGGSFSNLEQPSGGSSIDALQATIMNQAQFRKFADHNSAVFNFVVDVAPGSAELAGVRWYEFRQDGDNMPWTMYQEGTYTAPLGKHAWHASMAMDFQGNIGMGYTSMAGPETENPTNHRVGSFYTGRYVSDPLGTMTIAEEEIGIGPGNISGIRYGDYSKLDVDPTNDKTFWFINEYKNADIVGVFQIASDFNIDLGAVAINSPVDGNLSATETITITIFNYGQDDISNFDVTYQIDGGTLVTETYTGTIASASSAEYTFTTTGDFSTEGQTYTIVSSTSFATDEYNANDATTSEVTHLFANDTGVSEFVSPVSAGGLSAAEDVVVEITNFGSATQTNVPVFYTMNGGTPVQETYAGPIAMGETVEYTFTATADLSELGDYDFVAGTELTGDAVESNDDITSLVSSFNCQPESNCSGFGDGVSQLELAGQDLIVDCSETGYTDNTDIIFNFDLGSNPFEGVLQMGYAGDFVFWIDFNDDNLFSSDEMITTGSAPVANEDQAFTFDFTGLSNDIGMHVMRVRAGDPGGSDNDFQDPCADLTWGRTNDYTVNITGVVGIEDFNFSNAELLVNELSGNQFELLFNTTNYTDKLPVSVMNTLGQTLAYYTLENNGTGYSKIIDMSYVAPGVYFLRVGGESMNKVRRMVVK